MYTSHGHHIPGTDTANEPSAKAKCFGIRSCPVCVRDVASATAPEPTRFSAAKVAVLIEGFEELREYAYRAARANNGVLMGTDAWLRNAISETDLSFSVNEASNELQVYGSCYTTQTQSFEQFSFILPLSAL